VSSPFDFDRRLTAWLDEQAPTHEPDDLVDVALTRTRRTRQLPGWATLERWLPMQTTSKFGAVPRTALILVILAVLLAVVSAIALGQQPSPKLPPPLGVARNGLIGFDDGGDIWVVNPDGSGRQALTSGPAIDSAPEWSQDGTRIAYFSQQDPNGLAAIKVMDADGSDDRTLVDGVTLSPSWLRASWSHDGRFLAYSDTVVKGTVAVNRIMAIPVAGGDPVEVAEPGQDPTWSPDDRQIAYQSGGLNRAAKLIPQGLSVVGAGGTDQLLVDGAATDNPWAYAYPQWSPDGQRIAYHAQLPGDLMDIFVGSADGGGTQALGSEPSGGGWPVWSPDGTRIAYVAASPTDGKGLITLVNPDGSHVTMLQHPGLACTCAFKWSPDGTKVIAYQDGSLVNGSVANELLLVIDATGTVPVETITLTTAMSGDMSWQRLAR
jgi:Tol biopolymer transport system component